MDGPREIWATALALTLLDHALHDRRTFALLGFDARVKVESVVKAGSPYPRTASSSAAAVGPRSPSRTSAGWRSSGLTRAL